MAAALVGGVGVATFLVHAVHLVNRSFPALGVLFGIAFPMAFSIALTGSGAWLLRAGFGRRSLRVALWCLFGCVVLVCVGAVSSAFQLVVEGRTADPGVVLVAQATVGGLLGVVLGVYDTQRLLTREELLEQRQTADDLGRRLTVLNRVLRHDIRNSVNVIRGNAQLIVDGTSDPETVAETIRSKATQMVRMSEQAREIEAALSSDGLRTGAVDLSTVVAGKALSFQSRHGNVSVHRPIDGGAWGRASPLVDIAIENLLENAILHNDTAEPSVWVDVSTVVREGREVVVVRVEDDGPGIPEEQIAVVERGRETALEHTNGLGLWLVRWIVTASGGEVSFAEREPRGSVVELVLPRVEPADDESTSRGSTGRQSAEPVSTDGSD